MDVYRRLIEIIDTNIILCLIPLIITLMLIAVIFKQRFKTKQALNVVRWTIICYTMLTTVYFLIGIIFLPHEFAFVNRATGSYWAAYWLMLFCATLLPLTLFYKKLGKKAFFLLLLALLMKSGWYFERFVIVVTSYHRDYSVGNSHAGAEHYLMLGILVWALQGFIIAMLLLVLFEVIERIKMARRVKLVVERATLKKKL